MASKELSILIRAKDLASGAIRGVRGQVKGLGADAKLAAGNAARNIGKIGVIAAAGVAYAVTEGIKSIASIEKIRAETEAVLTSTGGVAGVTAKHITDMSQKWSSAIGRDEEEVQHLQNVLLTFTNISSGVFDDATTAALNMSQTLGQDLQSSAVQLGKALNDPIKGITALSRVGVSFTKQQKDQVKAMVEAGDTLGAQKLILAELNKEFGGAAEAFGQTTEGKFARFKQTVQAAERAIATGFLPVIEKVVEKVNGFLAKPENLKKIEDFGTTLAGALDSVIGMVTKLPWGAISSAFEVMGKGAKAALDLFVSAPPWLQTAVLTGWGLNKLTGGVLGKVVGGLAGGLIKGVLGMNAGVVNINAATVNGGVGAGTAAAGGGLKGAIGGVAKWVLGPAAAVIIGAEIAAVVNEGTIKPAQTAEHQRVTAVLEGQNANEMVSLLSSIEGQQNTGDLLAQTTLIASNIPFIGDALGHVGPELESQRQTLIDQLHAMGLTDDDIKRLQEQQKTAASRAAAASEKHHVAAMAKQNSVIGEFNKAHADSIRQEGVLKRQMDEAAGADRAMLGSLGSVRDSVRNVDKTIGSKVWDPKITVNNTVNAAISVSATSIQSKLVTIRQSTHSGGFI